MARSRWITGALTVLTATAVILVPAAANGAPTPRTDPLSAPDRTAISFEGTGPRVGTLNQFDSYPALSIAKLYIVDYAVRHGEGDPEDMALGERMIRYSDDLSADTLAARYPMAIDAIADEYRLFATSGADYWGNSVTSVADVVTFLQAKKAEFPLSPVLAWMIMASPIAADGTMQDWGTAPCPARRQQVGVVGLRRVDGSVRVLRRELRGCGSDLRRAGRPERRRDRGLRPGPDLRRHGHLGRARMRPLTGTCSLARRIE